MAVVVVGGHSRSVGKTSVVANLIARLPQKNWTACKITQFGHGFCTANGEPCDCETEEHTLAISVEQNGISIANDEVQRAILARARQFPGQEQQVFQFYASNPQAQAEIRAPLFEDKVVDFIAELATVNDRKVDRETLFADPEDEPAAA